MKLPQGYPSHLVYHGCRIAPKFYAQLILTQPNIETSFSLINVTEDPPCFYFHANFELFDQIRHPPSSSLRSAARQIWIFIGPCIGCSDWAPLLGKKHKCWESPAPSPLFRSQYNNDHAHRWHPAIASSPVWVESREQRQVLSGAQIRNEEEVFKYIISVCLGSFPA